MITLASTNNQNVPVCPSTTNDDNVSNPDTNTGLMTDSKLHSQLPSDSYVLNYLKINNKQNNQLIYFNYIKVMSKRRFSYNIGTPAKINSTYSSAIRIII